MDGVALLEGRDQLLRRLEAGRHPLVAGVLFAIAEIELQHVKERQAAGIAAARQRGVYKGRKPGATKAKPQRARELRAKGMKLPEIAQALNVNKRTVSRYLKRGSA